MSLKFLGQKEKKEEKNILINNYLLLIKIFYITASTLQLHFLKDTTSQKGY